MILVVKIVGPDFVHHVIPSMIVQEQTTQQGLLRFQCLGRGFRRSGDQFSGVGQWSVINESGCWTVSLGYRTYRPEPIFRMEDVVFCTTVFRTVRGIHFSLPGIKTCPRKCVVSAYSRTYTRSLHRSLNLETSMSRKSTANGTGWPVNRATRVRRYRWYRNPRCSRHPVRFQLLQERFRWPRGRGCCHPEPGPSP